MLVTRTFASFMAVVVVLTMSCCASLQAAISPVPATTSHACCDKDKDKDKKKDGEKQKHNCQCGEKLPQVAASKTIAPDHFISVEVPAVVLFEIAPVSFETTLSSLIADSPPPAAPALRHLHCLYLI